MLLSVIITVALAQTPAKVEIIKGGTKKKRAQVSAPADTSQQDALAAKEKALTDKEKELEVKTKELEAKNKELDLKHKDLDEQAAMLEEQKEEEKKRSEVTKKQADKLVRDQAAAMDGINGALGGN